MLRTALSIAIVFVFAISSSASDWPHWRGPKRTDVTDEPSGWNGKSWLPEKPAWTAKVGEGASSPIVVGDRVYCFGFERQKDVLRCLNAADGKELWSASYKAPQYGRFHMGDENFYAGPSSTPEFDAETGFIFTLGNDGDLNCWDTRAKGKKVWGRNLYDDFKVQRRPKLTRSPQRDYGYTSSPLLHGDWLLVEVGSTTRGSIIAFDRRTGKEVWASELKDEAGHTAGPAPITVEGVPCVALLTQRHLAVIRLDRGNEGKTLATFPWVTDFANTIASPAVHGDSVLITAGYNHNAIVKLKIRPGEAKEVWRKKYASKVCTPVIHDGSVYVAWQRVRCLDWETGELRWEGGVIGDPGSCIATSDGRLIVFGNRGKLILVEGATRSPKEYKELAVKDQIFNDLAWPHVALANGRLFCRDRVGNVVCFEVGK
ncbi:MAG TPA: PQQ-binding-like beta-propeller repeat protein [Gemmata sp.]|nr:PQQ-binding-like beta-propeller repeat protein [Gemmata sp.]